MDIAPLHRAGPAMASAPAPIPAEKLAENRAFLLDRETQRPVIRLVDRKTKDVIRQIPPEYVLQRAGDLERR